MPVTKAVLFDFGGTLFDFRTLRQAEKESLTDLVGWSGIEADLETLWDAFIETSRETFADYLSRPYYLHRDLFRDAIGRMLSRLGGELTDGLFDRYREVQWERHRRDFELREGVIETLACLRSRGLYLGIVSNIDEDQLDNFLDMSQLKPCFESCLSSEKARSCKPDRGIFDVAVRMAGCRAGEALFVGDTPGADIAGANRAGLPSVLIRDHDPGPSGADPIPTHTIRKIPELLDLV